VVFTGSRLQADVVGAALSAQGMNLGPCGVLVPDRQVESARKLIEAAESSR